MITSFLQSYDTEAYAVKKAVRFARERNQHFLVRASYGKFFAVPRYEIAINGIETKVSAIGYESCGSIIKWIDNTGRVLPNQKQR